MTSLVIIKKQLMMVREDTNFYLRLQKLHLKTLNSIHFNIQK